MEIIDANTLTDSIKAKIKMMAAEDTKAIEEIKHTPAFAQFVYKLHAKLVEALLKSPSSITFVSKCIPTIRTKQGILGIFSKKYKPTLVASAIVQFFRERSFRCHYFRDVYNDRLKIELEFKCDS